MNECTFLFVSLDFDTRWAELNKIPQQYSRSKTKLLTGSVGNSV